MFKNFCKTGNITQWLSACLANKCQALGLIPSATQKKRKKKKKSFENVNFMKK